MEQNEEYLRLPHGMFDRNAEWVRKERVILENHDKIGKKMGFDVMKYTPLGFSKTFERGVNTTIDKVYQFDSKTGKSLMLSSDSTASVFREYVVNGDGKSRRISFVAPLFRYRNSHSRHFTQIGYAIINETKYEDDFIKIVELCKNMTDLFKSMKLRVNIFLNDFSALRRMLSEDIPASKMPEVLHLLQFFSEEERIDFFDKNINDNIRKQQLKNMFTRKAVQITNFDEKCNYLKLPQEYLDIYKVAKNIDLLTNVNVFFDPINLHSIETIDNFSVRFVTTDGVKLGDGGEYSLYAQRFDKRIFSFWSVATGIEAIERNSTYELENDDIKKIALINIDATSSFVVQAIKYFNDNGYSVVYHGKNIKVGKVLKKIDKFYTHFCILGSNEENSRKIVIKDLNTKEEILLNIK